MVLSEGFHGPVSPRVVGGLGLDFVVGMAWWLSSGLVSSTVALLLLKVFGSVGPHLLLLVVYLVIAVSVGSEGGWVFSSVAWWAQSDPGILTPPGSVVVGLLGPNLFSTASTALLVGLLCLCSFSGGFSDRFFGADGVLSMLLVLVVGVCSSVQVAKFEWGCSRITSSLCLVMASPTIVVNEILKEAPQLNKLREASFSSVRHSRNPGMSCVELLGKVTHTVGSQDVCSLGTWDCVIGEYQFSPSESWQFGVEGIFSSHRYPLLGSSGLLVMFLRCVRLQFSRLSRFLPFSKGWSHLLVGVVIVIVDNKQVRSNRVCVTGSSSYNKGWWWHALLRSGITKVCNLVCGMLYLFIVV
ncbi:hypothetical protein SOVF_110400 [Spinacia oleracea]|nr:hypothetical protein SOVF_110400 [Spinacia oleracea]